MVLDTINRQFTRSLYLRANIGETTKVVEIRTRAANNDIGLDKYRNNLFY